MAGLVITRQQPSTARGFRFFTLADEHAHLDLVFRPPVVQRTLEVSRHPLLMVDGRLQVEHGRVNVLVEKVTALTPDGDPIAHPGPALPRTADFADRTTTADRNCDRHMPWTGRDTSVTLRQQCPDMRRAARDRRHRLRTSRLLRRAPCGMEDDDRAHPRGRRNSPLVQEGRPGALRTRPGAARAGTRHRRPNLAFEAAPRAPHRARHRARSTNAQDVSAHVAAGARSGSTGRACRRRSKLAGVRGGPGVGRASRSSGSRRPPSAFAPNRPRSTGPVAPGRQRMEHPSPRRSLPAEPRTAAMAAKNLPGRPETLPNATDRSAWDVPKLRATRVSRAGQFARHRALGDPGCDPGVRRLSNGSTAGRIPITPSRPRPRSARSPRFTRPRRRR